MELGAKVIVLYRDEFGAGCRLANAFRQNDSSTWRRKELPLQLSLEGYGLTDVSVSGQVINFVDLQDSPQVSMILLQNYKAPINACVAYEVLKFIMVKASRHTSSSMVIFPSVTVTKSFHQLKDLQLADMERCLYMAEINGASDFPEEIAQGLTKLSPTAQICDDPLACMLHFAQVLKVPALLLLAPTDRASPFDGNRAHIQHEKELQMLCKLGGVVANHTGLKFSKELLESAPMQIQKGIEDDWRRLYG